jgi:2'-5' RNA ligase
MVLARLFMAMIPPAEMQDYAHQVQQLFAERYGSRADRRSPPHITLQAPFQWDLDQLDRLAQGLERFGQQQSPVPVTLSGFGAFPPRVIFIQVLSTPELLALQASLATHCQQHLGIEDPRQSQRPFHPHLTVAFRDLTRSNFRMAWPEFARRQLELNGAPIWQYCFQANQFSLLLHEGQRWNVWREFPLLGGQEYTADDPNSGYDPHRLHT